MREPWCRRDGGRGSATIAIALGLALLLGCGTDRGTEIEVGCRTDDEVPPAVRTALEAGADSLFARLERGALDEIYANTATATQEQGKREEFLATLQRALERTGSPRDRVTTSVSVVHFGGDFPPSSPVECTVEGSEDPRRLIVSSYPLQASLVQRANAGPEQVHFSTLWHGEEGKWKLAAFFAKPATLAGRGWQSYAEEAASERLADRVRNSALLYNIAIDLVVPNAWTQPEDLPDLRRKQGRLRISDVPTGKTQAWPAEADTFRVFSITTGRGRGGPGLVVRFWAEAALDDTLAQRRYADRLFDYMESRFPEYEEAFHFLTLVAADSTSDRVWVRSYPLGEAP